MQSIYPVFMNFLIPGIRLPLFGPKRNWYSFTETVNLQPCTSNSTDNTGIMNDINFYTKLDSSEVQIRMSGCAEGIADNKKCVVWVLLFVFGDLGEDVVDLDLAEVSICLGLVWLPGIIRVICWRLTLRRCSILGIPLCRIWWLWGRELRCLRENRGQDQLYRTPFFCKKI